MTTDELQKLTPEEKRILIAEACGWTKIELAYDDEGELTLPKGTSPDGGSWAIIPDYLNSLDAMHESEKTLTANQLYWMENHLVRMTATQSTDDDWKEGVGPTAATKPWHATAAQRADAFLLTITPTP